jgi:hypothetical protein
MKVPRAASTKFEPRRFLARSCDELGRGVDADDPTVAPDALGRRDREGPGPAPDVEDGFSGRDTRKVERQAAKLPFVAAHDQPTDHEVVEPTADTKLAR